MRAMLIDGDGQVVNLIEYDPDGDYTPPARCVVRPIDDDVPVAYLGDAPADLVDVTAADDRVIALERRLDHLEAAVQALVAKTAV